MSLPHQLRSSHFRLLAFLLIIVSSTVFASPVILPAPPQLSSSAYLLMDAASGKVIVEHNADDRVPPASLTKMMTAYIVSEEVEQGRVGENDLVRITDNAWKKGGAKSGGSTMFLDPRTEVAVIDLLRGVIVQSGNDAAIALAEHLAGGETAFADVMNQQAQILGMSGTTFENATGWPAEGHLTTARDMAILARAIIHDHPEHYAIYAEKYYKYNGINQPNRNQLLFRDKSVDGLKTGHTEAAGYCLVASSIRNGMRLISVVMGTSSEEVRANESQKLLSYGFRYYSTETLYEAGEMIAEKKVWSGKSEQINLLLAKDIMVTIPRGERKNIKAETQIDAVVKAPIEAGDELGELLVKLDGGVIAKAPLVAENAVEEAGFFGRLWDSIRLKFE